MVFGYTMQTASWTCGERLANGQVSLIALRRRRTTLIIKFQLIRCRWPARFSDSMYGVLFFAEHGEAAEEDSDTPVVNESGGSSLNISKS